PSWLLPRSPAVRRNGSPLRSRTAAFVLAVGAAALATPAVAGAAVRSATFGYDKPEQPLSLNPQPPITQQAEYPQAITVAYDEGGAVAVHIAIFDAATWSWRLPPLTLD